MTCPNVFYFFPAIHHATDTFHFNSHYEHTPSFSEHQPSGPALSPGFVVFFIFLVSSHGGSWVGTGPSGGPEGIRAGRVLQSPKANAEGNGGDRDQTLLALGSGILDLNSRLPNIAGIHRENDPFL